MTSWDLGGNVITGPTQYLGTQTNNNQPLAISTNGVERVRVDTSGNVGIGTSSPGSKLVIREGTDGVSLHAAGAGSGIGFNRNVSDGAIYNSGISAWQFSARDAYFALEGYNGAQFNSWAVTKGGNVGIGTTSPGSDVAMTGGLTINGTNSTQLTVQNDGTSAFALNVSGGQWTMYDKLGGNWHPSLTSSNGNVGIGTGTNAPISRLDVRGNVTATGTWTPPPRDDAGGIPVFNGVVSAPGQVGPVLALRNPGGGVNTSAAIDLYTYDPGEGNPPDHSMNPSARIQAVDDGNYANDIVFLTNAPGATNNGLFERMRITSTGDILLPGADCAEHFDIVGSQLPDPGTVLVIDESGALREGREPYDTKVAGVVSGAGDCSGALVLDKRMSEKHRVAVALVGKVYCKVDAGYSSVAVGDLLTTSPTPGHAMKAAEHHKSFGAIIGKALKPLATGCGLIPILVALQ